FFALAPSSPPDAGAATPIVPTRAPRTRAIPAAPTALAEERERFGVACSVNIVEAPSCVRDDHRSNASTHKLPGTGRNLLSGETDAVFQPRFQKPVLSRHLPHRDPCPRPRSQSPSLYGGVPLSARQPRGSLPI